MYSCHWLSQIVNTKMKYFQDNHKNSMAGQTIIIDCVKGDEVVVYAYTGTWLADFPMNHYTHWVGLLLKPNMDEVA